MTHCNDIGLQYSDKTVSAGMIRCDEAFRSGLFVSRDLSIAEAKRSE